MKSVSVQVKISHEPTLPSEKCSVENAFRKIRKFFLRKKVFSKNGTVPKWNDPESILLSLERVLGRSEMDRSRIYSAGFETLSLYFGTISLLSNKFYLWTHS